MKRSTMKITMLAALLIGTNVLSTIGVQLILSGNPAGYAILIPAGLGFGVVFNFLAATITQAMRKKSSRSTSSVG